MSCQGLLLRESGRKSVQGRKVTHLLLRVASPPARAQWHCGLVADLRPLMRVLTLGLSRKQLLPKCLQWRKEAFEIIRGYTNHGASTSPTDTLHLTR